MTHFFQPSSDTSTQTESYYELIGAWQDILNGESSGISLSIALSNTPISGLSFRAFSQALAMNESLEFLALEKLTSERLRCLAEALKVNKSLRYLKVSNSYLGDNELILLAVALKDNHNLLWLDISSNHVSNLGAHALADLHLQNQTLRHLNIKNNPLNRDAKIRLEQLALHNLISLSLHFDK